MKASTETLENLSVRIPETGCQIWMGTVRKDYGYFERNHCKVSAHRTAWELQYGHIPEGLCVLHRCDIPLCINPHHLFLGTTQDNTADRDSKNRQAKGDKHWSKLHPELLARGDKHGVRLHPECVQGSANGMAKLTEANIRNIRSDLRPVSVIAVEYNLHVATIYKIRHKKLWPHVV